jgi:hypothetical protein
MGKEIRMSESDSTKMPKSTGGDMALTVGKIGLSFIPVVGGAASEILGAIVAPQLEKRRTEWFERIARDLEELKGKVANLSPENLSQNESFVTTFLHATAAILRNCDCQRIVCQVMLNSLPPS